MGLIEDALGGSRRALARLATLVERNDEQARAISARVYPMSGRAVTVGVTGPPGVGKSTLVNRAIAEFRKRGKTVAVIAVDPSSPISGGAALGDRIRMLDKFEDPGVFIRSMASRGKLGGLGTATPAMMHLVDAAGFDVVIVETVGVGQEEVDVSRYVDTTVLVQVPGLGDAIQAMKAGILEVADVYVVNKADLDGADATAKEIRAMLTLGASEQERAGWSPKVVKTSAKTGSGIEELVNEIERHRARIGESGALLSRRKNAAEHEVQARVEDLIRARMANSKNGAGDLVAQVAARTLNPFEAADLLLAELAKDQQPA